MKDTVIPAGTKRRELKIWLACFIVANIINWCAIIHFSTPWYEVFSQLGYVTVTSLLLYGLMLILRIAWKLMHWLTKK